MVTNLTRAEDRLSLIWFGALHAGPGGGLFASLSSPPPHSGKDVWMLAARFHWDCYMLQMCALEIARRREQHDIVAMCERNAREALDAHFDALEGALESIGWASNG